jgi:beta-glucosidase
MTPAHETPPSGKAAVSMRRRVLQVAFVVALGLLLWLGWSLKGPDTIAVKPALKLPAGFIWGVSSSAFQSEGGVLDSDWSRHNATDKSQDRYGSSVDFRHRYRQDIALAHDLGVNTYRIGINWARVEPRPGQIDPVEMAYYDDVILAIRQAGIAPLITLDHFDIPGWVADQGGWTNPKTTRDFVAYSGLIAKRYHKDVHLWITFNEAYADISIQKSLHKLDGRQAGLVGDNIVAAHRQVYDLIHQLDPHAVVTSNVAWLGDRFGSRTFNGISDRAFLDRVADKCDVIAIDYYGADLIKGIKALAAKANWVWPPEPAGLYRALKIIQAKYPNKPILIAETGMATENGLSRADGFKREDVLRDSVYWTQRARADGVNVIGYMVWSLTDNFEWGTYAPRFGLYTVNVLKDPSLRRIPTAAVPAYKEIIRNNGVGPDYRPVIAQ